jgi:hypothetical protein
MLPDITHEVECFLNGYDRLVKLPLISDAEVESLFSAELLAALERLRQHDLAEGICAGCSNRCCGIINCELYDPAFGVCPAFSLRPLLCRMHYCHKFEGCREEIKIIGDIFLEGLLAMERQGNPKTALFDSPPLAQAAPALAGKITALTAAFKEGRLDRTAAITAIQTEAENYRTAV